jgi:TrmH family RNA methyltransferase
VELDEIMNWDCTFVALDTEAEAPLSKIALDRSVVAIFGNEARGLRNLKGLSASKDRITPVRIPMPGNAESLNLSVAASIVMYQLANIPTS